MQQTEFNMANIRSHIVLMLLAIHINSIVCEQWEHLHCSSDSSQDMPEGSVADIGRFPWLGIVQHTFFIAGKAHYAVTGAVLIHPVFAIAPAEDIAKISSEQLRNNTKLILWGARSKKYALDVHDYIIHPEYHEQVTFATIALLDLIAWGESPLFYEWKAPVLPVCLPFKGSGTFENKMYAVKMTDTYGTMEKEILKMTFVENQVCEEFYYKNHLNLKRMNPVNPLCAVSEFSKIACVWDGGTALITRQSWGFWKLLGFAVRGPGCGAPTRFLNIHDYVPWINDVISEMPYEDAANTYRLGLRRVSPILLYMYNAQTEIPKKQGQCDREYRGNILYRDSSEFIANKPFTQAFYYLTLTTLSQFTCLIVDLIVAEQTNAAVWVEHDCHKDVHGLHNYGTKRPMREKMACFLYFKSVIFLEFRFVFTFKGKLEVTMYSHDRTMITIPNPFKSSQFTEVWWPTEGKLKFGYFAPQNLWWWHL